MPWCALSWQRTQASLKHSIISAHTLIVYSVQMGPKSHILALAADDDALGRHRHKIGPPGPLQRLAALLCAANNATPCSKEMKGIHRNEME